MNNNNQEVFDVPTLGYTDWRETMEKVIEFGIKNWKIGRPKKTMLFNFPTYVKKATQRLTFVAQFNNRFKLAGMCVEATFNKEQDKVDVSYIE